MKTLGHLKSYDIQLTVQSPLFIGSGEKLRKKEYLFLPQENKAIILDTEKLIVFLSRKNLLEKYQNFLLDNTQKNIYSFFRKNDITFNDYKYFSSYTIQTLGDTLQDVKDLQLFVKDAQGNAYIPGSSLKGAFRTAWLAYMLNDEPTDKKNERNHQWKESLEACHGRRDFEKSTQRTMNQLEAEYFNTLNVNQRDTKNMVNSVMRGISFSDSTPIDSNQLILTKKIDLDINGRYEKKKNDLPILRECLKPATTCRFTLTLDEVMLKGTGINIEQIMHILQWFCRYQLDHFYKKFKVSVKLPLHSKDTLLWLGGGVGFQNKTINGPALGENNGLIYTSKVLSQQFYKHHHDKDVKKGVSPHTIKIATYQNVQYLMGQCKLEVMKDK